MTKHSNLLLLDRHQTACARCQLCVCYATVTGESLLTASVNSIMLFVFFSEFQLDNSN